MDVRFKAVPEQTGLLLDAVIAAEALMETFVVAVAVHPAFVTVTVYVPEAAGVTAVRVGF